MLTAQQQYGGSIHPNRAFNQQQRYNILWYGHEVVRHQGEPIPPIDGISRQEAWTFATEGSERRKVMTFAIFRVSFAASGESLTIQVVVSN